MAKTERIVFLLALLAAAFGFLSNPINGVLGVDSSIFAYVARRLGEGALPYLDVFDQKGPLLYVIDWIGWPSLGVAGILLLDCVALGISLVVFRRLGAGAVALSVLVVLYHFVACGGNMPEQWIVVFSGIAYVLALEIDRFHRPKLMWAIMGFCVAQVMTRCAEELTLPKTQVYVFNRHFQTTCQEETVSQRIGEEYDIIRRFETPKRCYFGCL